MLRFGNHLVLHLLADGLSAIQQARLIGARVIGTASQGSFEMLRSFGAEPVAYGVGLEERLRRAAPEGVAALDCVGTEEALITSSALVADRSRIISIANPALSAKPGVRYVVGSDPASYEYRSSQRERILDLAARGELAVPVARTFSLAQAEQAFDLIRTGHPGGKLALIP